MIIEGGPNGATWWDKVPLKFNNFTGEDFTKGGYRAVPGSIVRHSAFIARNVVLMPSFVNVGPMSMKGRWWIPGLAWAPARRSARTSISRAGPGFGGVLEPLQANPTIIEDNCSSAPARKWLKA